MSAKKPTQPPKGADMNALVKRVDELSQKVLNKSFSSKLPVWKRWVGGEGDQDGVGLRDVVQANAVFLDAVKNDTDALEAKVGNLANRVKALEDAPSAPFPGSG